MMIVRVIGGHCAVRDLSRLAGLIEGAVFRYFGDDYRYVRDHRSGRWTAIHLAP